MKQGSNRSVRDSGGSSIMLKMDRSPRGSQGTADNSISSPSNNFNNQIKSINQFSLLDNSVEQSVSEQISKESLRITKSISPSCLRLMYKHYREKKIQPLENYYIRDCSKINYFSIILGDLNLQIDSIINSTLEQFMVFDYLKDIILKFDKLRADYHHKLKGNSKSQALTKENIDFLNIIFAYIRFILTRFGRIINYFDSLEQQYNRRQFSKQFNYKVAPAIQRLQQMESSQSNNSFSEDTQSASKSIIFQQMQQKLATTSLKTQQFFNDEKNKRDRLRDILIELTEREKNYTVEKYMKLLGNKWREEQDEERRLHVPLILCRLCSQNFFADREKEHSQYCFEKIKKMKEQQQANQVFLELSGQVTECMVDVEKKNAQSITNTPLLNVPRISSLLNTPTLQRRSMAGGPNFQQMQSLSGKLLEEKIKNLGTPKPHPISFKSFGMDYLNTNTQPTVQHHESSHSLRKSTFNKKDHHQKSYIEPRKDDNLESFEEIKQNLAQIPLQKNSQTAIQAPAANPQNPLLAYTKKVSDNAMSLNPITKTSITQNADKITSTLNSLKGLEGTKSLKKLNSLLEEKPPAQETEPKPLLKQSTFNDLHKVEEQKKEEVKKPVVNYMASIAGLRKELLKEEKKDGTPNKQSQALSFFKSQKIEEKKNLEEKQKVIEVTQASSSSTIQNFKPQIQDYNNVILPKSPYIQKMHCAFRDIAKQQQQQQQSATQENTEESKVQRKPSLRENLITSPYIGIIRGEISKEQKQKLKQHIQKEITKGTYMGDKDKKNKKKCNATDNAFQVTFKNQRDEVIKNIENLRKSVKIQKRANPLEKLMAKIAKHEEMKQQKANNKQLQSIEEEDAVQSEVIVNFDPSGNDIKLEKIKVDSKIEEIKSEGKQNQMFKGMSPIITCSPLKAEPEKITISLNNTPLGTPIQSKNNSMTPRQQQFQSDDSQLAAEEKIKSLQNAKKELDILESLKSMIDEAFNLSLHSKSIIQQKKIFQSYLNQIQTSKTIDILGFKGQQLVKKLQEVLDKKVSDIDTLITIEKNYDRTLPMTAAKLKKEEEKLSMNKLKKYVSNSITALDEKQKNSYPSESPQKFLNANSQSPIDKRFLIPMSENKKNVSTQELSSFVQGKINYRNLELSKSPSSILSETPSLGQISIGSSSNKTPIAQQKQQIQQNPSFNPSLRPLSHLTSPPSMEQLRGTNQHQIQMPSSTQPVRGDHTRIQTQTSQKLDQIEEEKVKDDSSLRDRVGYFNKKKSQFNISESRKRSGSKSLKSSISDSSFSSSSESRESSRISNETDKKIEEIQHNELLLFQLSNKVNYANQNQGNGRRMSWNARAAQQEHNVPPKGSLFQNKTTPKSNNAPVEKVKKNMKLSHFGKIKNQSMSPARLSITLEKIKFKRRQTRRDKFECQSDIVVGMNYNREKIEDEREIDSDYHEQFFVQELFNDLARFNEVVDRVAELDAYDQSSEEDEEDEEETLTMSKIRFNSVCILPSELESCNIDNVQDQNAVSINDFILLKTVSSGAYGKVILARKKNTKDMFAVKVLEKEKMIQKNVIEFVINERNILNSMNNDFIVRGVYTFQSTKYLYMVMEFMKGGDFANLLEQFGYFDETVARYYLSQIVLALEYLHQNGIIHRDMKPDNILVDADGHIKLTDFGLSEAGLKKIKENVGRTSTKELPYNFEQKMQNMDKEIQEILGVEQEQIKHNEKATAEQQLPLKEKRKSVKNEEEIKKPKNRILGTADYMAPEVIKGEEHTPSLDYWSLGVITYEFLVGALPFNDQTPEKVFQNILNRRIKHWPTIGTEDGEISQHASDFMNQLLEINPKKRLGANGVQEVKNHPFFKGINWDKIMEEEPPFVPAGKDFDPSYFPKANEQDEELKQIINDKKNIQKEKVQDFNKFEGVCYGTLQSINAKEAKKAMQRAAVQAKKQVGSNNRRQSFFRETILIDMSKGKNLVEQLIENKDETPPAQKPEVQKE